MKKILFVLPLAAALFFACEDKKGDNTDSTTEVSSGENTSSDSEPAKTYTVADFVDAYAKEKSSLEGKTVIIEGYCSGYVPLRNKNKDIEHYRVPLSADQEYKVIEKKVFFIFGGNTDKKDFLRPIISKTKLKIRGKVTNKELLDKPILIDAKIVS